MTISTQRAKSDIRIREYLSKHGYEPVNVSNNRLAYFSVLRVEKTPSFYVHERQGDNHEDLWHDKGSDEGGSIIDLVLAMDTNIATVKQALRHLADYVDGHIQSSTPRRPQISKPKTVQSNEIKVRGIKPLTHGALLGYLEKERKLSSKLCQKYLRCIFYDNKNRENLFGLAWPNDSGGHDIRSGGQVGFKSVAGVKDISTISGTHPESTELYVFEGMLDFLTFLEMNDQMDLIHDVIVLNTSSLAKRLLKYIEEKNPTCIHTFFDNDKAGDKAMEYLKGFYKGQITPNNDLYEGFSDLNDYWVNEKD